VRLYAPANPVRMREMVVKLNLKKIFGSRGTVYCQQLSLIGPLNGVLVARDGF
jgi:hypothetical protein